ncbi:MAG: ATP-dependent DNA helicase RecG [Prevotellaceae bacterium]|jgi:ATP-dependent DNA helicase RecG|nr:ATP-dependent DNA helicase RecG [Prevotellaceae bacterium]
MILETEIKFLPGIGPKRAGMLKKELDISTFKDMLYTFPYRYIDRTKFYKIGEITEDLPYIQFKGKITRFETVETSRNKRLIAYAADDSGDEIQLVFFRGIKWVVNKFKSNTEYVFFGKPNVFNGKVNIVHPEAETADDESSRINSNIQAVYSSTELLKDNFLGTKAFNRFQSCLLTLVYHKIDETLPEYVISQYKLLALKDALLNIHFPQSPELLRRAEYRLKFEELFYIQLSLLSQRLNRLQKNSGFVFPKIGDNFNNFYRNNLPFELTNAQKRVIKEIREDFKNGKQMNRLLQGDVGSGKTLVALICMLIAIDNGFQACIMAPTEILANQHYQTINEFLKGIDTDVRLLTGSTKKSERKTIDADLISGKINILVGTHALIEDKVRFGNLGFAVIDEQHRFGVEQRAKLRSKNLIAPHVLVMTATPIPRTLAMTLYGDLDVSVIDELPPGRRDVKTFHFLENRRLVLFGFMRRQIAEGRQIYVVYPLIKESEKMDYKNLEDGYFAITQAFPAPEYVTCVVHGKMKADEKDFSMNYFASGRANILVATSVIEVGVNVPNASVMVIESAERFGLSQLHQLRGRVGRGAEQSYCFLMSDVKLTTEARKRMQLMVRTGNGFEIAEEDLRLRGPGDIEGTQQSGLPFSLKISNLAKDGKLLEYVRSIAAAILNEDNSLQLEKNSLLRGILEKNFKKTVDYSAIS